MNKLLSLMFLIVVALIVTPKSQAATQVKLVNGKSFIDYELTNQTRKRSLATLEKDFNRVFTKLAEKHLKDGRSLSIEVTNLDLAGDKRFNAGPTHQDIRIIKEISPLKLYFNYKVLTKNGEIVKEGEYKLKEFLSLSSSLKRHKNKGNLSYFIPYLEKWFKAEFNTVT